MAQLDNPDITGVVLDGGRGARMGGVNKGLVEYQGRYLFEYSVENLRHHTASIIINSNTDHTTFRQLGFTVIDDGSYPYCGPLAGIHAGMRAADTPFIAVAPCDQLSLPRHVYARLIERAGQSERRAAFAVDADNSHPTCAVLSVDLADSIRQCLDADQLRLGQWMKNHADAVALPDVTFANINSMGEMGDGR